MATRFGRFFVRVNPLRWTRFAALAAALLLGAFSPLSHAVSAIQISVARIDSPLATVKDAHFQVDLKGAAPGLTLKAAIKPSNAPDFMPFSLTCARFDTAEIGQIDCGDGQLNATAIHALFSANFVSHPNYFSLNFLFNQARFSDQSGLHAGENLVGSLALTAQKTSASWRWNGKVNWTQGELYWQPYYFAKAGNFFEVNGTFQAPLLQIERASLQVNEVGQMQASALINTQTQSLQDVKVTAQDVDFAGLYNVFLKPALEKSIFGNLVVAGKASWQFEMDDLQPKRFTLHLVDARVHDINGKFALNHVNANIPWDYDVPQQISLDYENGYLLNLPLAKTKLEATLDRYAVTSPRLTLPILDGALQFEDVSAAWLGANWAWHLRMDLKPISMNQFSVALGWPEMQGIISGSVPLITYINQQLNMDGAMRFNVFDGTATMDHLRIDDPLGVVPRLYADISMRKIDLGDLTRTYNFGAIEGKLDGDVKGLVLENWRPVRMDASVITSEDKQIKKISQRAVENITALGGEGTAAALQRTFLRFFKQFNYDKIGLSCQLRNDVCKMGGVMPLPPASTVPGYVIVKGSGIPAVNVNGYTDYVSLTDLLDRIKRVTDSNTKAIVR